MTADAGQPTLAAQKAAAAADREKLLAQLEAADAAKAAVKAPRFRVVQQFTHRPEHTVCGHRFEWVAERCAYRRVRKHAGETGVHYTVRRADA